MSSNLFAEPKQRPLGHLYAIDFARGLAAIVVVLWHYQHFFFLFPGVDHPTVDSGLYPGSLIFWPAYCYGYAAVYFFWLISGFVFAAVYATRPTTSRAFFVNRLARLYPLHFVTLLVVALLQLISWRAVGHSAIYANNDPYHFFLQLFFASHWGLERGYSFNGPIWSVSIEVAVYALFWATRSFIFRLGIAGPLILAAIGWVLHYRVFGLADQSLFLCVMYFFAGCAIYLLAMTSGIRVRSILTISAVLVAIGSAVAMVRPSSIPWFGLPPLFIGLLMALCAVEVANRGRHFESVRWIGDNTYGMYLWHVPIQIIILIVLDRYVGSRNSALDLGFLAAFLVVVVVIARLSFLGIERPARDYLRKFA